MLRPLEDRILVKRKEAVEKTAGGVYLPERSKEVPDEGIVIAVGEGRQLDSGELSKMLIKENDIIMFAKYSGSEIKIKGEPFLLMRQAEVLAILDDDEV